MTDPDIRREEETAKLLADRFSPKQEKRKPGRPAKTVSDSNDKELWISAVMMFAKNKQVKHEGEFSSLFELTDKFVEAVKSHLQEVSKK